jgi:hypothetical protein
MEKKASFARNFYHKPVASINWDFKLVIKQHCHPYFTALGRSELEISVKAHILSAKQK